MIVAGPTAIRYQPQRSGTTSYSIESTVDFTDGTSKTGLFVSKTAETIKLKEGQAITGYPMASVKSVSKPVSSMPPMGLILPKSDVRDLIAFLRTLTSETEGAPSPDQAVGAAPSAPGK